MPAPLAKPMEVEPKAIAGGHGGAIGERPRA